MTRQELNQEIEKAILNFINNGYESGHAELKCFQRQGFSDNSVNEALQEVLGELSDYEGSFFTMCACVHWEQDADSIKADAIAYLGDYTHEEFLDEFGDIMKIYDIFEGLDMTKEEILNAFGK